MNYQEVKSFIVYLKTVSLIGSYEISRNGTLDDSIYGILKIRNCTWQYWWFTLYDITKEIIFNCNGVYS